MLNTSTKLCMLPVLQIQCMESEFFPPFPRPNTLLFLNFLFMLVELVGSTTDLLKHGVTFESPPPSLACINLTHLECFPFPPTPS